MFLITFTRTQVKDRFLSFSVEEVKINSLMVTIVTDNFLSKYIPGSNGFSIIESPLVFSPDFGNIIFSQTNYDKDKNVLSIFKSTLSGSTIYYHLNSKGEFFCSTHISMLRKAGVPIEENAEVLPEFFVYRKLMPTKTMYKNIYRLVIGGKLQIRILNGECVIESVEHYNLPKKDQNIASIYSSSKIAYDYLYKSIEKLNSCKNEIALLLSGGIDSSILCTICKDNFGTDTSYSTGYPFGDPKLNTEKRYAISAAQAFGMNHHYYESTNKDYLIDFLESISKAEEPLNHLQTVCVHSLFKKGIPENKKIVILGSGAGPSFGNFRNYLYLKDKILYRLLSTKESRAILGIASKITGKGRKFVETLNKCASKHLVCDPKNLIWSWSDYGSKKWVCDYFNVTEEDIIRKACNFIKKFEDRPIYDICSLYSLFNDEDITESVWAKIGEENGRILYSPFYDLDVLNYVFSIPWKLKMKRPENILRKEIARRGNVPEFIIARPKSGFGIRNEFWSEKGGVFEPLVPLASKVFDEKQIRDMQSLDPKKAMTFWNILNYAIWKRLCINNEPLELLVDELKECISSRGLYRQKV